MILAFFFAGITLLILLFLHWTDPKRLRVESRIDDLADGYKPREALLQEPFSRRVALPALAFMMDWFAKMTPSGQRDRLVERLVQAGIYSSFATNAFLAGKGLGMLLGLLLGWAISLRNVGLGLTIGGVFAIMSLYLPDLWLSQKVVKRQEDITVSLPDVLDLITAAVEAGLGLDAAIMRISGQELKTHQALFSEFERYLTDTRLGTSKSDALSDLGWRCGVGDLQAVVAALLQADSLGVGIGGTLRIQSEHLRTKRRQRAQEAALKAPIKMLFPMVFFIFPAIFIVTLGPAVLRVVDTFAKMPH